MRLQAFIDRVSSIEEAAAILGDELQALATEWAQLQDKLKRLPPDELTNTDNQKVALFRHSIQDQLEKYGFVSFRPSEIVLSRDNFRPLGVARDDDGESVEKEIGYEISESDGIRLKWSYYLAMMVLSLGQHTNHPALVIFDEPGQQEIEAPSLYAFLDYASRTTSGKQQAIVSTSEPIENIRGTLGAKAHIVAFDGFILQPL